MVSFLFFILFIILYFFFFFFFFQAEDGIRDIGVTGVQTCALPIYILDLSKIEAGKLELSLAPVSVESVCQSSLRFVKQSALKKSLSVCSQFDPQIGRASCRERV